MKSYAPKTFHSLQAATLAVSTLENSLSSRSEANWSEKYVPVSVLDLVREAYDQGYALTETITPRSKSAAKNSAAYALTLIHTEQREFMGDKVSSQIQIVNSFDAKKALKIQLGMFREVCSNGLMVGNSVKSLSARHQGDKIIESVSSLNLVDPWPEIEAAYSWMSAKISDNQAFGIIDSLPISEKAKQDVKHLYTNPLRIADSRGDVWSLYNTANEAMEGRARSKWSFFNLNSNLNEMIKRAYKLG